MSTVELAGVTISKPDKVLVPATADAPALTKHGLAAYYASVADAMLPHLRGRPVNMQRFPDGIEAITFYEKQVPAHFPGFVRTVEVQTSRRRQRQVVVDDVRALVYLANQACLTPHTWLCRADRLDRPDQLVLDLDPSVEDLAAVRRATRLVGEAVDELGLVSCLKTTGSRGYHVVVPLRRTQDFGAVRTFARALAERLVDRAPDLLTLEARKAKRGHRVLLDIGSNGYGQTIAPAYAVRPRPGAPVSTPLGWHELARVRPDQYTVATLPRRLARVGDPWSGVPAQDLRRAARLLGVTP